METSASPEASRGSLESPSSHALANETLRFVRYALDMWRRHRGLIRELAGAGKLTEEEGQVIWDLGMELQEVRGLVEQSGLVSSRRQEKAADQQQGDKEMEGGEGGQREVRGGQGVLSCHARSWWLSP